MTDEQKNEEAHGLWELAVARLAAVAETVSKVESRNHEGLDFAGVLGEAVAAEREAFKSWQEVSRRVTR